MSEQDPFTRQEQNHARMTALAERNAALTDAERRDQLIAGVDMMAEELARNPQMFARKMGRSAFESMLHADRISADLAQIQRERGITYQVPSMSERRRRQIAPTDEERLAEKIAASDAYYASLPPLVPGGRR